MNTTTEKKRFTTRDVMVIAAMMVLTFAVYGAVGALTLPFPFLYLYCAAGIQEFFCATFYLVVANRLNKHGILMVWSAVFGIISALGGYVFLLPYFLLVGVICELVIAQRHRVVLLWPRHDYRKHCSDLGCLGKLCGKGIHGRLFSGSL